MADCAIVIPTFQAHLGYVESFLKTYNSFVLDKEYIDICIILGTKEEQLAFNTIVQNLTNYESLNIKTYCFDEILLNYNIQLSSANLLNKLGKFSYQTIKKLYAVHYLQYPKSLIIDSESLIVKKTKMKKLFDDYFANPYVFYSNISYKEKYFKKFLDYKVLRNTCDFWGIKFNNLWFFEAFHWFYDIKIINDIFNSCNNNLYNKIEQLIANKQDEREKAIFDCTIYYLFIYINNDKYKYQFVNILDEYKKLLSKKAFNKIQRVSSVSPIFMAGWHRMRYNLIKPTAKIYKKYSLSISRPYIGSYVKNYVPLYKFINAADIHIIVATNRVNDLSKIINLNKLDKLKYEINALFRKIFNIKNNVASLCNKAIFILVNKNNLDRVFELHNLIEQTIPLGFADFYFVYENEELGQKQRCAYKRLFLNRLVKLSDNTIDNLKLIFQKKYEKFLFIVDGKEIKSQFSEIKKFLRKD